MDQNSLADTQSQQSTSAPVSQPQASSPSPATASTQQSATAERMLSQSEVNSLIGRSKQEAEERGRQRALQELNSSNNAPQSGNNPSLIGGITQDDIRRIAAEESRKQQEEIRKSFEAQRAKQQGEQIINELFTKLDSAKEKYQDFEQKVTPYLNAANARVLALANQFDNTADLVYELANRPSLLEDVDRAYERANPQEAYRRLSQLSESIKLNKAASNIKTPNDPLSQIKASPVGSSDGRKGVSYWRGKQF